jgi:hypothetical protein
MLDSVVGIHSAEVQNNHSDWPRTSSRPFAVRTAPHHLRAKEGRLELTSQRGSDDVLVEQMAR